MSTVPVFTVGEQRHTSAGNVFEFVGMIPRQLNSLHDPAGARYCLVKRVKTEERFGEELWDADVIYRWFLSQWESLPLVGKQSHDPSFGVFLP